MSEAALLSERDELVDLIKSPGFARFVAHAKAEWNSGYPLKVKQAVQRAKDNPVLDVQQEVACVDAANDAIDALLTWPHTRLEQLNQGATEQKRPFWNRRRA